MPRHNPHRRPRLDKPLILVGRGVILRVPTGSKEHHHANPPAIMAGGFVFPGVADEY